MALIFNNHQSNVSTAQLNSFLEGVYGYQEDIEQTCMRT